MIFIRAGILSGILSSRQESMIYRNKLFAGINDFQTLIITGINYLQKLIICRNKLYKEEVAYGQCKSDKD